MGRRALDIPQGPLLLAAQSILETHLWERWALGKMLKARFRCLRPMEDGRGQDRKESLGLTWICCSIRKDMICGKGAGA